MNFRKASSRDRQVEAWTKLPEEEARIITELAKEYNVTEYSMIRKLIRAGMRSLVTFDKRYAGKPGEVRRVRANAKVGGSLCPWFFPETEGRALEVQEEAASAPPWEA